jgi:pimeloyl-ACP methyl ester carboxylesterase
MMHTNDAQISQPSKTRPYLRWIGRILTGLILLVLLLGIGGAVYQANATASDASAYPPPGQLVDVGGYKLHVHCMGTGSPTVVMDAGWGNWSIFWSKVQPEIAENTRVCTFDRAGYGWSEPGPQPRTSRQIVDELYALLKNANIAPPYILVGHSFGGYDVRVYADRYPDEVVGMALVEAAHAEQWQRLPPGVRDFAQSSADALPIAANLARVGLLRVMFDQLPQFPKLPPASQQAYQAVMVRPEIYQAMAAEFAVIDETAAQVAKTGSLGNLPLVVISAPKGSNAFRELTDDFPFEAYDQVWMDLQAELAGLSTNSAQLTGGEAGHYIHLDEPELVIKGIQLLIQTYETKQIRASMGPQKSLDSHIRISSHQ